MVPDAPTPPLHRALPIVLERHDLPPAAEGEWVRLRGLGYRIAPATTAVPTHATTRALNRAARRRLRQARPVGSGGRFLPAAALLLSPLVVLLAGPATAATVDQPTTTSTSSTTAVGTSTTTAPSVPTSSTTSTSTTSSSTTASSTTAAPSTSTTTTTGAPHSTSAGGPPPGPSSTVAGPPSGTTAPGTPAGTAGTGSPAVPSGRSGSTLPATVIPSSTPETTTTVPGAAVAPTVGTPELPPATPADADPVAAGASSLLRQHGDLAAATRAVADTTERLTATDVEMGRLEARVAQLTSAAFDLAHAEAATAEVQLARTDAQDQLDAVRTDRAGLALRLAAATTQLDDLSAHFPTHRLELATLVAKRSGDEATRLDAAWAATSDARLDVVLAALAQVGDPYVWGATGPDTFDCSGLTGFAWHAAGIDLPHYTVLQRQTTLDVAEPALRPGDLVFNLDGPNGGHVMLYLGTTRAIVHAPSPGTVVSIGQWHTATGFGSPLDDRTAVGDAVATVLPAATPGR